MCIIFKNKLNLKFSITAINELGNSYTTMNWGTATVKYLGTDLKYSSSFRPC